MNMNEYHNKPINPEAGAYRGIGEYYDPEEIAATLLQCCQNLYSFAGSSPDFDKSQIIDCLYWLKAAAENPKDRDSFRQLYNLLAAVNESNIIPF